MAHESGAQRPSETERTDPSVSGTDHEGVKQSQSGQEQPTSPSQVGQAGTGMDERRGTYFESRVRPTRAVRSSQTSTSSPVLTTRTAWADSKSAVVSTSANPSDANKSAQEQTDTQAPSPSSAGD